jgi:hypothetical protein
MRKSFFGLVVAGATLAGAIGSALPASAVAYKYNGTDYDVTTLTGTLNGLWPQLTDASNLLWNDKGGLASGLADVVGSSEGLPNGVNRFPWWGKGVGPLFIDNKEGLHVYFWSDGVWYGHSGLDDFATYAKVTGVPVPWETDAISVIGSTILFAGGLWARNKFAKPLQK